MKKLIKSGTEDTGMILRGKDRISSDKNHNERVHMGTNFAVLQKPK